MQLLCSTLNHTATGHGWRWRCWRDFFLAQTANMFHLKADVYTGTAVLYGAEGAVTYCDIINYSADGR